MRLTEDLKMFQVRECKAVRLIQDGEHVPEVGELLTIHRWGRKAEKARVVGIESAVRQHKCTMYSFKVCPLSMEGKKRGF